MKHERIDHRTFIPDEEPHPLLNKVAALTIYRSRKMVDKPAELTDKSGGWRARGMRPATLINYGRLMRKKEWTVLAGVMNYTPRRNYHLLAIVRDESIEDDHINIKKYIEIDTGWIGLDFSKGILVWEPFDYGEDNV